jgi:cell division protein FtsB
MSTLRPRLGPVLYLGACAFVGTYLTFSAVQGENGMFRRIQIEGDTEQLRQERDRLAAELAEISNLTRRLSDHALDLDLLDQQARDVLGYVRTDEIVLR